MWVQQQGCPTMTKYPMLNEPGHPSCQQGVAWYPYLDMGIGAGLTNHENIPYAE